MTLRCPTNPTGTFWRSCGCFRPSLVFHSFSRPTTRSHSNQSWERPRPYRLRASQMTATNCYAPSTPPSFGKSLNVLVPEVGIEPTRPCGHGILSPARLPVSPLRHSGGEDRQYNASAISSSSTSPRQSPSPLSRARRRPPLPRCCTCSAAVFAAALSSSENAMFITGSGDCFIAPDGPFCDSIDPYTFM